METQQKWIKTKKRMPKELMRVEMKCKDGMICTGCFDPNGWHGKWVFDEWYGDERFLAGFQASVIEWRPL